MAQWRRVQNREDPIQAGDRDNGPGLMGGSGQELDGTTRAKYKATVNNEIHVSGHRPACGFKRPHQLVIIG